MTQSFQYEKKTVEILFSGTARYTVPDYQRGYAWDLETVEEFWSDIEDGHKQNLEQYFLGTLVLIPRDIERYEIVDGQQRIATLTMLFAIMKNKLLAYHTKESKFLGSKVDERLFYRPAPKEKHDRFKINKNDILFFSKYLLDPKVDAETKTKKAEKDSEERLLKAYEFFSQKIAKILSERGVPALQDYYNYLTGRVIVISIEAYDDSNAFHVFESINAKGVPLSPLDLLKNLLISHSIGETRQDVISLWDYLFQTFDESEAFRFFRYYWMSKYELLRKKWFYRKVKLKISTQIKTEELVRDLREHAKVYEMLLKPQLVTNSDSRRALQGIEVLNVTQVQPILLSSGMKFGVNSAQFAQCAQSLLAFVVRKFIIAHDNPNEFETESGDLARSIRKGKTDVKDLRVKLRKLAPKDAAFRKDFEEFVANRNYVAKYLLTELNRSSSTTNEVEVSNAVHLEHILPQKPTEEWFKMFDDLEEENIDTWIRRLGNLTLLDDTLNRIISNKSFNTKKKSYAQSAIRLTKSLCRYSKWDHIQISSRQKGFAKKAVGIWKI